MDHITTAHVARVAAHHRAPGNAAQTLLITAFLRDAHRIPLIEPTAVRGTAAHRARLSSLARSYRHGLSHCDDAVGFLLSIYNADADRLEAEARAERLAAVPLGDRLEAWLFDTWAGRAALAAVVVAAATVVALTAAPELATTPTPTPTPMGKAAP